MMDAEQIMEQICELCHWPYVETDQETMDERCDACTVMAQLLRLANKEE